MKKSPEKFLIYVLDKYLPCLPEGKFDQNEIRKRNDLRVKVLLLLLIFAIVVMISFVYLIIKYSTIENSSSHISKSDKYSTSTEFPTSPVHSELSYSSPVNLNSSGWNTPNPSGQDDDRHYNLPCMAAAVKKCLTDQSFASQAGVMMGDETGCRNLATRLCEVNSSGGFVNP